MYPPAPQYYASPSAPPYVPQYHDLSPYAAAAGPGQTYLPQDLPEPYLSAFRAFQAFVRASTMDEHAAALTFFGDNLVWDAPPILVHGKDDIRVIAYFAKTVAHLDVQPLVFKVEPYTRGGLSELEFYCLFPVKPNRVWWAPFTYLLPDIPIKASLRLSFRTHPNGAISIHVVKGRILNYPVLPAFVRKLNAFAMGRVGALLEPLWSKTVHLPPMNDPSYKTQVSGQPSFMSWNQKRK